MNSITKAFNEWVRSLNLDILKDEESELLHLMRCVAQREYARTYLAKRKEVAL